MTIDTPLYDEKCIPDYFCNKENIDLFDKWTYVKDSSISLNNWMLKYDLICADYTIISSFGMAYYAGFALSNLIIPPMSDKRGRKNWYLGSQLIQTLSTLGIALMPGNPEAKHYAIPIIVAMFFIQGCTRSGTQLIGYCMMLDSAPESTHSWITGIWSFSEGWAYVSLTLYYKYISKDTIWPINWSIF